MKVYCSEVSHRIDLSTKRSVHIHMFEGKHGGEYASLTIETPTQTYVAGEWYELQLPATSAPIDTRGDM